MASSLARKKTHLDTLLYTLCIFLFFSKQCQKKLSCLGYERYEDTVVYDKTFFYLNLLIVQLQQESNYYKNCSLKLCILKKAKSFLQTS
jgi:hypothetical protein